MVAVAPAMGGVQGGSDEVGVKPTKVSQENIYQANILSRIVNRAPARPFSSSR
jgi:hypothetical protein